jgi:hypothetical protein
VLVELLFPHAQVQRLLVQRSLTLELASHLLLLDLLATMCAVVLVVAHSDPD